MKVTILNGSENPGGTTSKVSNWLLGRYRTRHRFQGQVINLSEQTINPCGMCGGCNTNPSPCGVDDDVPQIVSAMRESDVIVYAVPVHAFGMASVMQRFIERAGVGYLRFERPLINKVGGVVVVGRRYSHESVVSQLYLNMMLNKIILPGSGFPPTFRSEHRPVFSDDVEAVEAAEAMVDRTVEVARALHQKLRSNGSGSPARSLPLAITAAPRHAATPRSKST